MTTTRALVVRLPYLPSQVAVSLGHGGRLYTVNLFPNGAVKGIGYARNTAFAQRLVTEARRQLREDAYWTTLAALGGQRWSTTGDGGIPVHVEVRWTRRGKLPDHDNALASVKAALDGVADGLGVNDTHFRPTVTVVRAEQGETVIRIGGTA